MKWFSKKRDDGPGVPSQERPAAAGSPTIAELRERVAGGGLSFIVSPPADFPTVSPDAHRLYMEGVAGAFTGDAGVSLPKFTEALAIIRRTGHGPGEARLLYNIGVAHYQLGDLDRAIEVLLEGRTLVESISGELAKEARRQMREHEELRLDHPNVEMFGAPEMEQQLLAMFQEALATVYEADGQAAQAAECRRHASAMYQKGR